jgi:hypothetical protein
LPGAASECTDENPCTTDSCDPKAGCKFSANSLGCNDGNACTGGDTCAAGACAGKGAVVCNDGNPCTSDGCDPGQGCVFKAHTLSCDDGNACSAKDTCSGGACLGSPVSCDDGNGCTLDSCEPKIGCQNKEVAAVCDDGSVCTLGDICSGGSCQAGKPVQCNDGNPCTSDSCDPKTGCVAPANSDPCSDGNACTSADSCSAGACKGQSVNCDDNDACTNDYCDPASGCQHPGPSGFKGCGKQCVSVLTDPANCGDCGVKCGGGELCLAGKCAAIICVPNGSASCYSGKVGTEGVGACKAGSKTCNGSGTAWATGCAGEVTPTAESCDTPADDDCDGKANPMEQCGPGVYAFSHPTDCGSWCYYDELHNIEINGAGQGANQAGYNKLAWGQLFDGKKGADLWATDLGKGYAYEWVGWSSKTAVVTFKLPKAKAISVITVGMDNGTPPTDVAQPTEVRVEFSSDGLTWTPPVAFKKSDNSMLTIAPYKRADVPLKLAAAVTTQWARLTFINSYWTFLDEVRFD